MAADMQCKVKDKIMRMGNGKTPSREKTTLGDVGKVCPGHQNVSLSFSSKT